MSTTDFLRLIDHDDNGRPVHRGGGRIEIERRSHGPVTLIVRDPSDASRLVTHHAGRWTRLAVWVHAARLDRQLAGGRPPESGRLLAARAQQLVSASSRYDLAQSWAHVLVEAERGPRMRNPRVRLDRRRIHACEPEIRELIQALLTPLPIPVRGAAMASNLLSDGGGPLYQARGAGRLGAAVGSAIANLDPALPLAHAA
jgi:hypothetical protein